MENATYFSLSPTHLERRSAAEALMNVELSASVATALARKDLPVPGGCKLRMSAFVLFIRTSNTQICC